MSDFILTDVFDEIKLGKPIHKRQLKKIAKNKIDGHIPYVTRTQKSNGIKIFVDKKDISSEFIQKGNGITIGAEGFVAFYQEFEFITGNKINILYSKSLNKFNALYLITVLNHEISKKFNYSRGVVKFRLKKLSIRLPKDKNDKPDWKYMEDRIKKIDVKSSLTKDYSQLKKSFNDVKDIELNLSNWKFFTYEYLFEIKKGKRKVMSKLTKKGDTPFVAAGSINNGVKFKTDIEPIHRGNTISVTYNGSIGEAYYQPEDYWASDDINVLYPKFKLNLYIAMFLITMIRQEKYRFNFGRKWHKERMKKTEIYLPATYKGKPDWKFMEDYIKSLPYSINLI